MHTPMENIEMFMEAGKLYGKYPIDLEKLMED